MKINSIFWRHLYGNLCCTALQHYFQRKWDLCYCSIGYWLYHLKLLKSICQLQLSLCHFRLRRQGRAALLLPKKNYKKGKKAYIKGCQDQHTLWGHSNSLFVWQLDIPGRGGAVQILLVASESCWRRCWMGLSQLQTSCQLCSVVQGKVHFPEVLPSSLGKFQFCLLFPLAPSAMFSSTALDLCCQISPG